jgi:DNA-binding NarL/FixJ family response regulator
MVAAGHNNTAIAAQLSLAPKTVRNYISSILTKLQVSDRVQAIIRARAAGLG